MTKLNEDKLADVTFHALVFDRKAEWDRTREALLRFLNSVEGGRFVAQNRGPVVVLASDQRRGQPYYLHVTDGALEVLRKLDIGFSIFTSAFLHELPENQVVQFSS
jgi:hypothetical protein